MLNNVFRDIIFDDDQVITSLMNDDASTFMEDANQEMYRSCNSSN